MFKNRKENKMRKNKLKWKDIKGYEGLYKISTCGDVVSYPNKSNHNNEKLLKWFVHDNGYAYVFLYKNGKRKSFAVHRLIASTFLKTKHGKNQVNHKDGIKLNNFVENLEWCSQEENQQHAFKNGLNYGRKGVENGHHRPINQYSKSGKFIKCWSFMSQISQELGINVSNICNCCKGKIKSVGGFVFKYAKEEK